MAKVFTPADARRLDLPGRVSNEIISAAAGADRVSLRLVELAPERAGDKLRGPHVHYPFEECIYVLSGEGVTEASSGRYELRAGDALLVPAGELHVTRNTGPLPLRLLCFFPVADAAAGTEEFADWGAAKGRHGG